MDENNDRSVADFLAVAVGLVVTVLVFIWTWRNFGPGWAIGTAFLMVPETIGYVAAMGTRMVLGVLAP